VRDFDCVVRGALIDEQNLKTVRQISENVEHVLQAVSQR
jgi:hypothetical protein